MVRSALVAFAAAAVLAAAASAETSVLNAAFAQIQQSLNAASPALRRSAAGPKAASSAPAAAKAREFNVEFQNRRWQLRPNTNPPGSNFVIDLNVGDKVKLSFYNWGNPRGGDETAQFDVDGIDVVVDGRPSKGIHVWLSSAGDSTVVEFDAVKAGIYPIRGSSGYILIRAAP